MVFFGGAPRHWIVVAASNQTLHIYLICFHSALYQAKFEAVVVVVVVAVVVVVVIVVVWG